MSAPRTEASAPAVSGAVGAPTERVGAGHTLIGSTTCAVCDEEGDLYAFGPEEHRHYMAFCTIHAALAGRRGV